MKKILSIILALSLVLGLALTASAADTTTVTVSIADYADDNNWSNGVQYPTVVMDTVISVTAQKTVGDYDNTGKYYTSGEQWRTYQTESPSITVTATGTTIVSVKITYAAKNTGVLTYGGSNITSGTVVNVNAASAVFGVANTGTATNGQVNITAIEVIYNTPASTCEHEYTDCEDAVCNLCNQTTRVAPGHTWTDCEDATCDTCATGTRTAPGHEWTNDYDVKCDTCATGTRTAPQALPEADTVLTYDVAEEVGLAQGHNTYTEGKYYLTGEITNIAHTTYGNMTIKDADGNTFYLYGLYSEDGETRYDAMTEQPAVGDTITVWGVLGQYNGGAQMKSAWLAEEPANTADNTPVIALVTLVVLSAAAFVTMISLKKREF